MEKKRWMWACLIAASAVFAACDDDDDNDGKALPAQDKEFVEKAARANLAEIQLGAIAVAKGDHEAVREYGERMVSEHQEALDELEDIEDAYSNVDFPDDLDDQHEELRGQLTDTSGYALDSLYIASQIADHTSSIALFENQVTNGTEQRLKDYASKYLPHLQEHLAHADSIWNIIVMENGQ